ncbi:MAG: glutamine amidotransferase, partial [Myxococcota bacterium]
ASIDAMPPLKGYVATSIKPRATLALQSPEDEPILAHWRVGLGKTLAFTSDAKSRWASHWLADPALYQRFWGQAVSWTTQTGSRSNLAAIATLKGSQLSIVVDSMNEDTYVSGADTQATVITPGGERHRLQLQQVAPGRYRTSLDAGEEGTYHVAVQQTLGGQELGRAIREVHRAWSPEFAPSHTGTAVLQELASSTGGTLNPPPTAVWTRPETPLTTPTSMVPWLLIALAVLWLVDIAFRRFEGFRSPTRHPAPKPLPAPTGAPSPRRTPKPGRRSSTPSPTYTTSDLLGETPPVDETPTPEPTKEEPKRFSSALLDAKRKRKGQK